jgi:two-component system chemotaxis response regulator CheB
MTSRLRVLVVDDSAFARRVVRDCLTSDAAIEVLDTARDGIDALQKIAALKPDVITLDLMMPNLDGIGVLQKLPPDTVSRVVICSTAEDDSAAVVHALALGAITSVHKPTALATDRLYDMGRELIEAVKLAGSARAAVNARPVAHIAPVSRQVGTRLVVIGASTGGPQALTNLLQALPPDFPAAVAFVVHMPIGYTAGFAARLNNQCLIEVVEADEGTELRPGRAVLGRAGMHMRVDATGRSVHLDMQPLDHPHRPSVDVLFASAAAAFGAATLGVVLTGMGNDGLAGSRAMVANGGRVIAQSAMTCVVYGMPRVVAEEGLAALVVGLDEIPAAISRLL